MRQPKLPEDLDGMRDFLDFAVPLRHAELAARYRSGDITEAWLTGSVTRGGLSLGTKGDTLQFSDGRPRTGRQQATVARTLEDLVTGIAAAALLAGEDGITILGTHFCTDPNCRHDTEQAVDVTAPEWDGQEAA